MNPDQQPSSPATPSELVYKGSEICPFLGMRRDHTIVADAPTPAHACYARRLRHYPDLNHQGFFCFGINYRICRYYPDKGAVTGTGMASRYSAGTGWRVNWGIVAAVVAALLAVAGLYAAVSYFTSTSAPASALPPSAAQVIASETPSPGEGSTNSSVAEPLATPSLMAGPTDTMALDSSVATAGVPPVQPGVTVPEGATNELLLTPRQVDVGWWVNSGARQIFVGDSFLYSGYLNGQGYVSAVRFDLRRVPRGAPILSGQLRLTGLRDDLLEQSAGVTWLAQLVAEEDLPLLVGADFLTVVGAPASIILAPPLDGSQVGVGVTNEWTLDEGALRWMEQQVIDGATSVTVRIAPFEIEGDSLFAWDSGHGSESSGIAPQLSLEVGPPPPTPPPTPTRAVIVATLTPEPENVLTLVAQAALATAESSARGTNTPLPFAVVTPTPYPENLATVQANAVAQGLPAVVVDTPQPQNAATVTAQAAYATAVALTTGTFTPAPTGFVTPVLYFPSPPAENVATAAARVQTATASAPGLAVQTPLPWNAVPAAYIYATETPENGATAAALVEQERFLAAAEGTPTATPWNLVVITRVPNPTPQATPVPLVVAADFITPTPSPTPTRVITTDVFEEFSNRIIFLSDRTGSQQTWAMNPDSGEVVALITDARVHEQARELFLPYSPSGQERVYVAQDEDEDLELVVEESVYGTKRQITEFSGCCNETILNYDPAWSPVDDRIAFVSTESGGDEIYTIDSEGNALQRLTFNTWEWDKHPTWSPDGRRIAFFSNRDSGRRQLWIMNADGTDQRNLSNNEFEDWDPVWIP